jgi:tyrosinase
VQTHHLLNLTIGTASNNIKLFQEELQGGRYPGHLGLHAAGHFVLGGDGTDLFASPNDPAFWLHVSALQTAKFGAHAKVRKHAMVDRVWWIWQALHPNLASTIDGTITMNNSPVSRNATIEDLLETLGLIEPVALGQVFNTLSGDPLCYKYD